VYEEYVFPSLRTVNGIAEALREELQHDIALCERRIEELGDQSVRKERET
jgi:hypothetical protein